MGFISFCKELSTPVLTGFAIGALLFVVPFCHSFVQEFKFNRSRKQLVKLTRELEEKGKAMALTQTLEAFEEEIKASQNEKLLRLHEALVKNIKASTNFELKE